MTRTHYEVLQVSPSASSAEVRTAYRAACLRTHPDKAKPEDKKKAEYEFRRVSAQQAERQVQQAYEVLSDDEKRKAYDFQQTNPGFQRTFQHQHQHQNGGDWVWPPHPFFQDASSSRRRPQDPFSHPFFNNDGFFTRPFAFGRSPPFGSFGGPSYSSTGGRDPFEDMMSSHRRLVDDFSRMFFQPATSGTSLFPQNTEHARGMGEPSTSSGMWSFMGNFNAADGGGHMASESRSESWINGQRHTTHRRRDANGVEHVTHTYPDGTTRHLVNGVEQQQQPYLHPPPPPH